MALRNRHPGDAPVGGQSALARMRLPASSVPTSWRSWRTASCVLPSGLDRSPARLYRIGLALWQNLNVPMIGMSRIGIVPLDHVDRPAEPVDLDALYEVCLRTGDAGEDASHRFADPGFSARSTSGLT